VTLKPQCGRQWRRCRGRRRLPYALSGPAPVAFFCEMTDATDGCCAECIGTQIVHIKRSAQHDAGDVVLTEADQIDKVEVLPELHGVAEDHGAQCGQIRIALHEAAPEGPDEHDDQRITPERADEIIVDIDGDAGLDQEQAGKGDGVRQAEAELHGWDEVRSGDRPQFTVLPGGVRRNCALRAPGGSRCGF